MNENKFKFYVKEKVMNCFGHELMFCALADMLHVKKQQLTHFKTLSLTHMRGNKGNALYKNS